MAVRWSPVEGVKQSRKERSEASGNKIIYFPGLWTYNLDINSRPFS